MKKNAVCGILIIPLIVMCGGCCPLITGKVVEAGSGKPVEGAAVFAEWTRTVGCFGLKYTESCRTSEAVTGKNGSFIIFGTLNPFVNFHTKLGIYKKGYVAWREYGTFPGFKERDGFGFCKLWYEYRLEPFLKSYSHSKHMIHIGGMRDGDSNFYRAYEWELSLAAEERRLFRKKREDLKEKEKTDEQLWEEVLRELYLTEENFQKPQ